jgi:hypothetical protein
MFVKLSKLDIVTGIGIATGVAIATSAIITVFTQAFEHVSIR